MNQARIMVIDDDPNMLSAITRLLRAADYKSITALGGREAMALLEKEDADLILCDWSMPKLSGLDTLRLIHSRDEWEGIPIILVTGRGDPADVAEGLDAGAVDFVSKPFDSEILLARIRNALRMYRTQKQLKSRNEEILGLAYAMTHDLKSPLASISGALGAVRIQYQKLGGEDDGLWFGQINQTITRMAGLLDELSQFATAGRTNKSLFDLDISEVLEGAVDEVRIRAAEKGVKVEIQVEPALMEAEPQGLFRVFNNLLANAINYNDKGDEGLIKVILRKAQRTVRIEIADNGPGIPTDLLEEVFQPFRRAIANAEGTGLGLAIVRKYVETFDGNIHLESDGESGTTAVILFPLAEDAAEILEEAA